MQMLDKQEMHSIYIIELEAQKRNSMDQIGLLRKFDVFNLTYV